VAEVVGIWVSEVRSTAQGPMAFRFHLAADGQLEIWGKPESTASGTGFHRSGSYIFDGGRLIAGVINEGRPAQIRLHNGELLLTIDETLKFRLRRE
jgi:hypothetical protein